jgi:hypothetical protein
MAEHLKLKRLTAKFAKNAKKCTEKKWPSPAFSCERRAPRPASLNRNKQTLGALGVLGGFHFE